MIEPPVEGPLEFVVIMPEGRDPSDALHQVARALDVPTRCASFLSDTAVMRRMR